MYLIKKEKGQVFSLPSKVLKPEAAEALGSPIAIKILEAIAEEPKSVMQISKEVGCHEQSIYYHIKRLKERGFIDIVKESNTLTKKENKSTTKTPATYKNTSPSFSIPFNEFKKDGINLANNSEFLSPFIKDNNLNSKIIVGSPDPHGPEKARSRDGYYGIDFALFLGTFLNYVPEPVVMLDTEVRKEDLEDNLIVLGGPIVNKVTGRINNHLSIYFSHKHGWSLHSKISGKTYFDDEIGVIVKDKNPFSPKHSVLLIAGKRYMGTKSAILAFLKYFSEVKKGNIYDRNHLAKVVRGLDLDSDGNVDDTEFLE